MNVAMTPEKGGHAGHLLRRMVHVTILIYPFLYYDFGSPIAAVFGLTAPQLLYAIAALAIVLEVIRCSLGWVIVGQRAYEARRPCAAFWTIIGVIAVLLFAPSKAYAVPIIACCALIDPLMGELRHMGICRWRVALLGCLVGISIWCLSRYFLGIPAGWAWLMGPLVVALEWPSIPWVDDNVLMLIVPLLIVLWMPGTVFGVFGV